MIVLFIVDALNDKMVILYLPESQIIYYLLILHTTSLMV